MSFEEAPSVLFDDYTVQFYDDEHSSEEDRFITLGVSNLSRVMAVCHCESARGRVIRIILARKATKNERGFYPQGAL